ncbi:hypothetical protein OU994_12985 [Pseudoduganella sp. SL102]|uniref:esterase/lipase family protein n=1 Tax=Pseudoduganella sp. SL102 TaxID=2995154 RepID=UPI00248C43D1|nr:hypothetical protein [Pseudoduganella sp. SL102]WBS05120.1 hypothetical protein OU994_12985 [Pseudoduganella sp. SL102]
MANSFTHAFQTGSIEERARLALGQDSAATIRAHLGEDAFVEYEQIAHRVVKAARDHLAGPPPNLIFIPGVMGSQLMSTQLGGIWWVDVRTRQHIEHLRLNAAGTQSSNPRHALVPVTTDPSYEPFRAAVLERGDFCHIVYPYDWRMSLSRAADGLRDAILGMHASNGQRKVHLVAHSMGGLLIRATLMAHGAELWPKIGRIAFIGTPHFGAPAIASYLRHHFWGWEGMALLGRYLSPAAFRSLRGVLELLPAPCGIYPGTRPESADRWIPANAADRYQHPCLDFDTYRATDLELALGQDETAKLQGVLDGSATFHRDLWSAHVALDQAFRDRMAVIAGVGFKTVFRLETPGWPQSLAGSRKITQRVPDDPHRDGDGRVPLASAQLPYVAQTRYVRGEHGALPSIPAVHEDVFRWLNGEQMKLPISSRGALADHLALADPLPAAGHLARGVQSRGDDPGYLDERHYTEDELAALDAGLDTGLVPGFNRLHIL